MRKRAESNDVRLFASLGLLFQCNHELRWCLDADAMPECGNDGMSIARYADFLDLTLRPSGLTHQLASIVAPHLLDFLNLKYILTPADVDLPADRFELVGDGPVRVYRNRHVMPRATLVGRYVVAQGDAAKRLLRRGEVDLTQMVVLHRRVSASDEPSAVGAAGEASIERYEDDFVRISTTSDRPRLLVLADAYFPGWVASVDGKPAAIHRANIGFRAVAVPAGRHVVEFSYRPSSVRIGFAVSIAGLLGIAAMFLRGRAETRDLDENTMLDVDADGNICAITVEHASARTGIPEFSYEQVTT